VVEWWKVNLLPALVLVGHSFVAGAATLRSVDIWWLSFLEVRRK
jgi:hypothetical protein